MLQENTLILFVIRVVLDTPYTSAREIGKILKFVQECYEPKTPTIRPPKYRGDAERFWRPRP